MRRGRLAFLGALLLAAAIVEACDSDTFTGGDGGEDATDDVPGVVGGGDAGDGGKVSDAAKDTSLSTSHFCDSQDAAFFCSDFDEPDATGVWIGGFAQTGAWTIETESTDASSKPNALEVDIVAEAGSATINTLLGNPFDAGASTSAVLDFDIVIPPLNGAFPPVLLFVVGCPLGSTATHFGLEYASGVWSLASQQGIIQALTGTVPTGVWTHVTMTIGLSQSATVSLDVGNGKATAHNVTPINTVGGQTFQHYPIDIEMGVFSPGVASPTGPVYYDNVVLHVQ